MKTNHIYEGDCIEVMKTFREKSIDMVMTSPPYWALRDYGVAGQLGLEQTFEEYITKLCDVFDEVKRVLKDEGTCWINIGDTYARGSRPKDGVNHSLIKKSKEVHIEPRMKPEYPNDKCLVMIPFRFAIEMVNRGWILRNTIIWHKPNCMPSSAKDRFTVDFEYLFLFSKKKKYYFEQQIEQTKANVIESRMLQEKRQVYSVKYKNTQGVLRTMNRNKRCVWTINPKPFSEAHFAVYPEELCEVPIKAGCPEFICKKCGNAKELEINYSGGTIGKSWHDHTDDLKKGMLGRGGIPSKTKEPYNREVKGYKVTCNCNAGFEPGIVLDPFVGAGTTIVVAKKQGKNAIGIELNPAYIKIAQARIDSITSYQKRLL